MDVVAVVGTGICTCDLVMRVLLGADGVEDEVPGGCIVVPSALPVPKDGHC